MDHEEAFLQAIIDAPDDDVTRLVYADWLEDRGRGAEGELIRLHVAWCGQEAGAPQDADLRERLLAAWKIVERTRVPSPALPAHVYDRGFVASVRFQGYELIREQVEAVFSHAPIQVGYFWQVGYSNVAWLTGSPLLGQLSGICCADPLHVAGQILESPYLSQLELLHLAIEGYEEAVEGARRIASARHLGRLTVLDLDGTPIGDEGLAARAEAEHLGSVRKLTLRSDERMSHHLGEAGIRALTASRSLSSLTHLGFCDCTIDCGALEHLIAWTGAGRLVELDLSFTELNGEDVVSLGRSGKFGSLRRLCLSAFELTDEAIRALADADSLPALQELHLAAKEEYGDWDDQTPEMLGWLAERLGGRLVLSSAESRSFELSPVGAADRIWHRLRRHLRADRTEAGVSQIL